MRALTAAVRDRKRAIAIEIARRRQHLAGVIQHCETEYPLQYALVSGNHIGVGIAPASLDGAPVGDVLGTADDACAIVAVWIAERACLLGARTVWRE